MADVIIKARMDPASIAALQAMTAAAVSRALATAARRITTYAKDITPVRTGALRDSFIASPTLRTITMIWRAAYAKMIDEGRQYGAYIIRAKAGGWLRFFWKKMGIPMKIKEVKAGYVRPARFSDHMRIVAPQFVREAIIEELARMKP